MAEGMTFNFYDYRSYRMTIERIHPIRLFFIIGQRDKLILDLKKNSKNTKLTEDSKPEIINACLVYFFI
jgi:hypothetical protein